MYYAVRIGLKTGIFDTWDECKKSVIGYKGAVFKKFKNKIDALNFINQVHNKSDTNEIFVYTDGSCLNNGKSNAKAGIGIFFNDDDPRNVSRKHTGKQTNNQAELSAILQTFKILKNEIKQHKIINIYTDSTYAIDCLTSYGKKQEYIGWVDNIPNKSLVKKVYKKYIKMKTVKLTHVYAHTGKTDIHSINNAKADKLAKKGAMM